MDIETKRCYVCKLEKPLEDFAKETRRKDGRQQRCRQCFSEWHKNLPEHSKERRKNYYQNNKEHVAELAKWRRLRLAHGISKEEYIALLKEQEYKCLICGRSHEDERNGLVVDHCHKTAKIRGLLCDRCNVGLGCFRDDSSILVLATNYLNSHKH